MKVIKPNSIFSKVEMLDNLLLKYSCIDIFELVQKMDRMIDNATKYNYEMEQKLKEKIK